MAEGLLSMFTPGGWPKTVAEFLGRSAYDELVELDLVNDRCRNIFHVEGKYFVPVTDGSFSSLYEYCMDNMVHPDDRGIFAELFEPDTLSARLAESEVPGAITARFRYRLQDGGWRWTEVCLIGDGRQDLPKGIVHFYIFDIDNLISRQVNGTSGVFHLAQSDHDALTGLLNERPFLDKVFQTVEASPSPDAQWCLIAIDIDHFKLFNEWYGRELGDFLLADFGARLSAEEEEVGGLAAYRGNDDFCLLAPYDRSRIDELFDDLCDIVAERSAQAGFIPVFGISVIDGPISQLELLDQAVIAAKKAKADFRKRICVFQSPMREDDDREYRILSEFRRGLESGEIFFQLQPQCRVSTGKIVGAEALVRWRRADGTMVAPLDFVPALEHHGFVTNLDCFIWEEACMWLRAWIDAGHKPIPVSVNVSQVDFYAIDVAEHFIWLVGEYELDPSLLKIEVTESAYVNNVAVIADAAKRLREKGFLVLMDDFGSGYSSLNTLRTLDVDVIKLDAQLIQVGKDETHKGVHILESIIGMAKSLSLPIIAEGVETEEQSDFLEGQGCRYVQGYKFYQPMNVEDLEAIIADEGMIDSEGLVVPSAT